MKNEIHKAPVLNVVTDQKDNLKAIIGRPAIFTNDELSAIHTYIDSLPGKRQLCHGDTNLGNLILRAAPFCFCSITGSNVNLHSLQNVCTNATFKMVEKNLEGCPG